MVDQQQEDMKKMVMTFRVSELQTLLGFAGQNKSGRKPELQSRALGLLRQKSTPINLKISEIYKTIQQETHTGGIQVASPGATNNSAMDSNGTMNNPANMLGYNQPHPTPHPQQPRLQIMNCPPPTTAAAGYLDQSPYQTQEPSNLLQGQMYPYQTNPQVPTVAAYSPTYPPHPGVVFKSLPFYDKLDDLVLPSSLISQLPRSRIGEATFDFNLTPEQATEIGMNRSLVANGKFEYEVQVIVRFSALDTTTEQDDLFPPGVVLKLNNKPCPLPNPIPTNTPGVEPKRPARPLNVTQFVKISPTVKNEVNVSWTSDFSRGYVVGVVLVRKLLAKELLKRLRTDKMKEAKFTAAIIQEKLKEDGDCDVATTVLRVSLICPLGKKRIINPCRPTTCTHLQCFDAFSYLEMNEVKPRWQCPVCNKPGLFQNLFIDGYFEDVLQSTELPEDHTEVKLLKDGTWSVLTADDELHRASSPISDEKNSTVVIDADDANIVIEDDTENGQKSDNDVILTLSDSEEDENKLNGVPEVNGEGEGEGEGETETETALEELQQNSNSSLNLNIINLDSPSPPCSPSNAASDDVIETSSLTSS